MSKIDQAARILKRLGGRELVLVSGQPARVMGADGKQLTEAKRFDQWEINTLVEETAPGDRLADILLGEPVEYVFEHELGPLTIRVIPGPSLWRLAVESTEAFAASEPDEEWLAQESDEEDSPAEPGQATPGTEPDPFDESASASPPQTAPPKHEDAENGPGEGPGGGVDLPPPSNSKPMIHWLEDDEPGKSDEPLSEPHMAQSRLHPHQEAPAPFLSQPGLGADGTTREPEQKTGNQDAPARRRPGSGTHLGMPNPAPMGREDGDTGDPFAWDEDMDSFPPEDIEAHRRKMATTALPGDPPKDRQTSYPEDVKATARVARQENTDTQDLTKVKRERNASDSSRTMRAIHRPGDPSGPKPLTETTPEGRARTQPPIAGLPAMVENAVKNGANELRIIEGQRPWMRTARGFGPIPESQAPVRGPAFDDLEERLSREQRRALLTRGWVRLMWDGGPRGGLARCTIVASRPRALIVHLHLLERWKDGQLGLTTEIIDRAGRRGLTVLAGPGRCGRTTLATAILERLLSSGLQSALLAGCPPELVPHVTAPLLLLDRTTFPGDPDSAVQMALSSGVELLLSDDCSGPDMAPYLSAAAQGLTVLAIRRSASLETLVRELAEAASSLAMDGPGLLEATISQVLFLEPHEDRRRRKPSLSLLVPTRDLWKAHVEGTAELADRILSQLVTRPKAES